LPNEIILARNAIGVNLFLVGFDEAALAAAIDALLHDDPLVHRMSRRAFAEARRLAPTPAQWCDELLALYARRLGARAVSRDMTATDQLASFGVEGQG